MIKIPDSFFPKDETGVLLCPKCYKTVAECDCPSFDPTKPKCNQFAPIVRLDKKGRKGRLVTLVQGLPADEFFLRELSHAIKKRVGGGGTFYIDGEFGVIEVQGDHGKTVRDVLAGHGFQLK